MNEQQGELRTAEIDLIDLKGSPQARAATDEVTVGEYAEVMREPGGPDQFPAIVLFEDQDGTLWLADGWHRVLAALKAGLKAIKAEVRPGNRRDALLCAVGANADHGLRRTNEDKRRAVLTLLRDPQWCQWSDREIANRCGVSNRFVGLVRRDPSVNGSQMEATRTVRRGDTTYTIDTANIGKTSPRPTAGPWPTRKPKPPPPPMLDHFGKLIPDGLKDAFGDQTLAETIAWLEGLANDAAYKKKVTALAQRHDALPYLDLAGFQKSMMAVETALDAAAGFLRAAVPYCVCPECKGRGCQDCMKSGYMTDAQHYNRYYPEQTVGQEAL
jgi:hypothetical protein